ncbi:uncharacterized protein [Drosophila tropicalis]|uniref:uncharacterized protein n=1 Tax=Drosophila tropicalis TaxID=46794 RepID=UPI0035ABA892
MQVSSKFELTNIKCTSLDKTFSEFEYCYLKSVNRSYKYFSLKVNLHKIPITNVSVNFSLMKRLSRYKPFLYNITIDACKYHASRNKNPVARFFHSQFEPYSNMNHTCPFKNDLIVDKVTISTLNHHYSELLPFPEGDYALFTSWYAYGINRADVKVYASLS